MEIFDYIKAEESRYEAVPVTVTDGWDWNMKDHITRSKLYLNSRFQSGSDEDLFFNIVLAPYNLQVRATDWDVKDVDLFAPSAKNHYKSFAAKKVHEQWADDVQLGKRANKSNRSYHAYGLALVETLQGEFGAVPEIHDLEDIAFCDQTDILAGPLGLRKYWSPADLLEMKGTWDDEAIDDAIVMSKPMQKNTATGKENATPGNYIKVYKVHGVLELAYLTGKIEDQEKYERQTHVIAEYQTEDGDKKGITLFAGKRKESPFDALVRDPIDGRACGRGSVEELFPEQVWTNYSMEAQKDILDQASVMLFQTADQRFQDRNILRPTQNGQVLITDEGKPITQVNNSPANIVAFEQNMNLWTQNSKEKSGSFEAITGAQPKSGQPFATTELLNAEAHGLHDQRLEDISLFWEDYYKRRIMPSLQKRMNNEKELKSLLTRDELERVDKAHREEMADNVEDEMILEGETVVEGQREEVLNNVQSELNQTGNSRFIKIPKDYFKDVPLDVHVSISGEKKNRARVAAQLSAVFGQIAQNPGILQDPTMAAIFNDILENSGLSPEAYGLTDRKAPTQTPQQAPQGAVPSPLQELPVANV